MDTKKFESEVLTLKRFFECYCENKECKNFHLVTTFKDEVFEFDFVVDDERYELLIYAVERLKNCLHVDKPKCRDCLCNCYDKQNYKKMAKIMIFGSIKLGFSRLKKRFL